mmetsp:Transcript_50500/g.81602  ORF Transcript_50500/g.81602 Transcript_50500/m.81602 type:complete len:80 (+) Transcript_50500:137-376(+)
MYKYMFLNWPTCESPPLTSVKLDHTPENQVLVDGACCGVRAVAHAPLLVPASGATDFHSLLLPAPVIGAAVSPDLTQEW